MAKLNTRQVTPVNTRGPIKTTATKRTSTYNGAPALGLEAKGELFTLAVTNMVSEDTYYESGRARDDRYAKLVNAVTKTDPEWVRGMLAWLRTSAHMRTASIVGVAEYVAAGGPHGRQLVKAVLQRADEPGELLAYWTSKFGKNIPQPIKRGIADALRDGLYNQYSVQKYDSAARGFRFADVVQLVHPRPADAEQAELFKYALDRRYQGSDAIPGESLRMLWESKAVADKVRSAGVDAFLSDDQAMRHLKDAGWTWERLSSEGAFTKEAWEAIIPSMGYMALLRNLRNFEQAGVREPVMREVRKRLSDPEQVARSKQFPYRFYSAFKQVENVKTKAALEEALEHSFQNIDLPGRTLVLIDVSGSMQGGWGYGRQSSTAPSEIAGLMGLATARGLNADVAAFGTQSKRVNLRAGGSVLSEINRVSQMGREVGHGTNIGQAIHKQYDGHDRVLVFTDMQSSDNGGVSAPTYIFDLAGYGRVPNLGGKVVQFAGWQDTFLKAIPLIERGRKADWPWESE